MTINLIEKCTIMLVFKRTKRILSKRFNFLYLIIFISSICLLWYCSNPSGSNDDTVTFSGTVTLEGETDHSGVKVSLYEPVELDTALVRINKQYPDIGVHISQEKEFDHREHESVYNTTTNAEGRWTIEKVKNGTYNVVAEKDSFGWRYKWNVNKTVNMILKKAKILKGSYSGQYAFENDFIQIDGDAYFDANSQLQLKGVNTFLFIRNSTVTIRGDFNCTNNLKSYFFTNGTNTDVQLKFENQSQLNLKNLFLINSIEFTMSRTNAEVENCIFQNYNANGLIVNETPCRLTNVIFNNSNIGAVINESMYVLLEKSIVINNGNGIDGFDLDSLKIANNYFNNEVNDLILVKVNGEIGNNQFENTEIGMTASDKTDINVEENNFINNNTNIFLKKVSHLGNQLEIEMHMNNFINTSDYIIEMNTSTVKDSVNALNNYWGTISEYDIQNKIYDANDNDHVNMRYVIYKPFLVSATDFAGIN